jgi:hypothetical protein
VFDVAPNNHQAQAKEYAQVWELAEAFAQVRAVLMRPPYSTKAVV